MPYSSLSSVPDNLKTAGLSLAQANYWAEIYDSVKEGGGAENPGAVAWTQFKRKYKKENDKWVERKNSNREYSKSLGIMVLNSASKDEPVKFRFIAQTEGVHSGSKGPMNYTPENLKPALPTLIGKDIKDDPIHASGDERFFSQDFAEIISDEYITLTEEMVSDFKLDSSLVGKGAIACDAEVYNPIYEEPVRRGKIKVFSTEFSYDELDTSGEVPTPKGINYTSIAAIRDNPADVGAVMLQILNRNDDKELKDLVENYLRGKTTGGKTMDDAQAKELQDKLAANQANMDEKDKKIAELEATIADLKKALAEKEGAANKLSEEQKKLNEKVVAGEAILNKYVEKDRKEILKGITNRAEIVNELADPAKTSQEVFNKEVEKLKSIVEEVKASAAVAVNNTGYASVTNTNPDKFKELFGVTKEEKINQIISNRRTEK